MARANEYKLAGLNHGGWKAGGFKDTYATVEYLDKEDWFHADIDMPHDRLEALWNMMKTQGNFKNMRCIVEFDEKDKPIVKEIFEV